MPYQNDVFISYKRGRINEEWLNEIFLPLFEDLLNNALPYEPKVFIDRTGLTPGVDFTGELMQNLLRSKCLVSIWSPPYFRRSEWCIREFLFMKYRQESFKLDSFTKPKTLLWPVVFRKIEPLPVAVQNIHYVDYSAYNLVGDAFKKDPIYLNFQRKLITDIEAVVDIIENAPAYDESWDTPDGRRDLKQKLDAYYEANNNFDVPISQKSIQW